MMHVYFPKAFFASLRTPLASYIHVLQIQVYRSKVNHTRYITLHEVMKISPADFLTTFLIYVMRATCPANLLLLALITRMIFG
jgi:hypothetical protein